LWCLDRLEGEGEFPGEKKAGCEKGKNTPFVFPGHGESGESGVDDCKEKIIEEGRKVVRFSLPTPK